jgi:tetratricopeptide (TPR) repeat protein
VSPCSSHSAEKHLLLRILSLLLFLLVTTLNNSPARAQGTEASAAVPTAAKSAAALEQEGEGSGNGSPRELFAAGNRAYQAGDYATAAKRYASLVQRGISDGYLLYNLGNAYYKMGDLGQAILAYERARRLIPRYPDLAENLAYLKVLKHDKDPDAGTPRYVMALRRLIHGVTLKEISWATLITWLLLALLLVWRLLSRRDSSLQRPLRAATWTVALLLTGAATHTLYLAHDLSRPAAIVIAEEVAVRSGPSEEDITEFKLHAGTRVLLERRSDGWSRIALSEELRGWCPSEAVEEI